VYRSGRLNRHELASLCVVGVQELIVLSGTADRRECRYRDELCPNLKIRYDNRQLPNRPVSASFLGAFVDWIEEAQDSNKKIAIRCKKGWHRTGRLAAFYRMAFNNQSSTDAISEMHDRGRFMWMFPGLRGQVRAYEVHLRHDVCSDPAICVSQTPEPGIAEAQGQPIFRQDVCNE
jgi:protein-tyrosine phosphatase